MAVSVNEIQEDVGKSNLRILVVGKAGVGKSSLINSFMGYEACTENEIEAETSEVCVFEKKMNGIQVELIDSPGLYDAKGKEKEYFQQIIEKAHNLDLVLYCTRATDTRVTEEDFKTICQFTRVLGKEFWKNSLFVLTFANMILPTRNIHDQQAKIDALKKKKKLLSNKLYQVLEEEAGVPAEVVKKIPAIPAGYHSPECQTLPDGSDWFTVFWFACLTRIKEVKREAIIIASVDNFEKSKEMDSQATLPEGSKSLYPKIKVPKNRRDILMGIGGIAGGLIGGNRSGALVGTLIGGLLNLGVDLLEEYNEVKDKVD